MSRRRSPNRADPSGRIVRVSRFRGVGLGLLLGAGSLLVAAPLQAQDEATGLAEDPLFATLFPPELIMQHRRAIGLTDQQRDQISRLIQDLQGEAVALQWELLDEVQQLGEITSPPRVDLDRALDQIEEVLDTESRMKRAHLEMLVRIKNLLTPEQQRMLEELRGPAGAPSG